MGARTSTDAVTRAELVRVQYAGTSKTVYVEEEIGHWRGHGHFGQRRLRVSMDADGGHHHGDSH
jgi:hypothetical protein